MRLGSELLSGAASGASAAISPRLALFWYATAALVLGILLAKWTWVLFAPHATATAAVPERVASAEAGRLFGVAVSNAATIQAAVLPNVELIGVFAAGAGKPGFAVLKVDGKQLGIAIGENVVAGTKLFEVYADHVLLERAGIRLRVDMEENKAAGITVAVPAKK